MERWTGRVALVTGASEGIGAEIVKVLVENGMKVVGCARNVSKIEKLSEELKDKKGTLKPIKCDLNNEEEILKMFQTIKEDSNLKGVDVCINNAGLSHDAPLLTGKTQDWKNMMDVNVMASAICTKESFQSMKERQVDDGHIIFISSMSGHRIVNENCTHFYSVTKHAVRALIEGTRQELRNLKSHIRVTGISPGNVNTPFAARMFEDEKKGTEYLSGARCIDAKDIADTVLFILKMPAHVEINDVLMRPTEGIH